MVPENAKSCHPRPAQLALQVFFREDETEVDPSEFAR